MDVRRAQAVPVTAGQGATAAGAVLAGAALLWLGVRDVARFWSGMADRTASVAGNSAMFALPLLGAALLLLGALIGRGDRGGGGALFAGFLVAGAGAVLFLVLGPALVGRAAAAQGYRACAATLGMRTAQTRYGRADLPCAAGTGGR